MEGARVLVIDDSPTIRKLVELTLRPLGWSVAFAGSGREGIARATASPPDLVVLDFVLPDMRGIDVCARLAGDKATERVPIVVVTAKRDEVRSLFAPFPSVLACMPKPFTAEQLQKMAAAAAAKAPNRPRPTPTAFTREEKESAAQTLFSRLRTALGSVPQWATELGAASPAAFFAKRILTPERVESILEGLLPIYRDRIGAQATALDRIAAAQSEGAALHCEARAWPVGDLLNMFSAAARTGELTIRYGEKTLFAYWRNGEVLLVTTNDPDEYLRGATLGRIDAAALARARAEQRASGKPAFVSLAEDGAALSAPLGDLLQRQGRRLLLDAIDATAATFTWRDRAALPLYVEAHGRHLSTARNTLVFGLLAPKAPSTPPSSLEQLTLERLRREPGSAPIADEAVFDRVRGFTDRIRRFDLVVTERRVLAALDGMLTAREVATRTSLALDEVRAVLGRLTEIGLIEEQRTPSERPVLILEPDVDNFQRPLEALLRTRADFAPVRSLKGERDIVAAIHRERPRLVILNAAVAGGAIEQTARAVRASSALADVSLVAILDSDGAVDPALLHAAGFDAVFVKPVPYADLERLLD
jgi:CheY-like chemotaxis protein